MTVRELLDKLASVPEYMLEWPVYTSHYESGYDTPEVYVDEKERLVTL